MTDPATHRAIAALLDRLPVDVDQGLEAVRDKTRVGPRQGSAAGEVERLRLRDGNGPPGPASRSRRALVGAVAIIVFLAGGAFAFRVFTGHVGPPASPDVTGDDVDGTILWPEQTGHELAATEAQIDAGDPDFSWRLDPTHVATAFAEGVLGWGAPTSDSGGIRYAVTLDPSWTEGDSEATVSLSQMAIPCPSPPPGEAGTCPPPYEQEQLLLRRSVSPGGTGVWTVTEARASGFELQLGAGDHVDNGDPISGNVAFPTTAVNLPDYVAQYGFTVSGGGDCTGGSTIGIQPTKGGDVSFPASIGKEGWTTESCAPIATGFAFIASGSVQPCPKNVIGCPIALLIARDLGTNDGPLLYGLTAVPMSVSVLPTSTPEQSTSATVDSLPEGWTDLGPLPGDLSSTTVWTGSEILVWGGGGEDGPGPLRADGFRLNPISGETTPVPEAPIAPRANAAAAWTGQELLIWGGWSEGPPFLDDGAALDPTTDTWRTLPPAPISPRVPLSAWTGTEWILWGTGVRVDDRPLDGAAYDPATNTWRSISPGPIEFTDATAMWTGKEFVVVGAALHGGNFPETQTAVAAAYVPATDEWRELPASPLDPNSNTAVWTGDRIVGVDQNHVTAMYDPARREWSEMGTLPGQQCEGGLAQAQAVQGWVFISDCGTVAVLPPGETRWSAPAGTPEIVYTRTLAAGDAVLVFALPAGGDGADLWAFRPSSEPVGG
jgi:Kelch motif